METNSVTAMTDVIAFYTLNIALAIVVFVVGKWLALRITNFTVKLLEKQKNFDETLIVFFKNIIYYILLIIVVLSSLNQLGIQTTSFLAILGAAGLAVGLALKDSLSNFAAGVMIILFRPFKIGDIVNAAGITGKITEIHLFSTEFTTPDNQKILVPNSSITSSAITNINVHDKRRVDLLVGIGYDDDIKKAKEILQNLVSNNEKVLKDDGITVAVSELADSSVNFVVRAWVNTPDYWDVKFALTEAVKVNFDKEGISIPYPQSDVHIYKKEE